MSKSQKELEVARKRFTEACTDVLQAFRYQHPLKAAQSVWTIPSDLAAHGFQVSMVQDDETGWSITVKLAIGDAWFEASGKAESLVAALRMLAGRAESQFEGIALVAEEKAAEAA